MLGVKLVLVKSCQCLCPSGEACEEREEREEGQEGQEEKGKNGVTVTTRERVCVRERE
jgi:hypothetical protein